MTECEICGWQADIADQWSHMNNVFAKICQETEPAIVATMLWHRSQIAITK